MAVEIASTVHLAPLITPTAPAYPCVPRAEGFKLSRTEWAYELTPAGREQAAICQRMVLSYALGYENRSALSQRYGYAARHIQSVLSGQTYGWLTRPVRERLAAHGIFATRMDVRIRNATIRGVLEELSGQAVDMIRWPEHYSANQRETLTLDLYLISGAWREEQP